MAADLNIVHYAEKVLDTFDEKPFGSIDALILSWVSYLQLGVIAKEYDEWEGFAFKELFKAEHFDGLLGRTYNPEQGKLLLTAMAASPRFRDMKLMGYTEQTDMEAEKQFSAVSIQLTPQLAYISFRGTDSSIVGWKEDFNMAFQCPVPSQVSAQAYLIEAAEHCAGRLRVGGHSKGGNLAVYASATGPYELWYRIDKVYSHDGPGFMAVTLERPEFERIGSKIEKILPKSSIIGMLLDQDNECKYVDSNKKGISQHDLFSWLIEDEDFIYVESLDKRAQFVDDTLTEWLAQITPEERGRFIDVVYAMMNTEDFDTLGDWWEKRSETLPVLRQAYAEADEETKAFLKAVAKSLASEGMKRIRNKEKKQEPEPERLTGEVVDKEEISHIR